MLEALLAARQSASSETSLLMHFDGNNGDTVFVDEKGNPITGSGPVISSAQSRFGETSGYFANNYLSLSQPITLDSDYTIECWVYRTAFGSQYAPVICGAGGAYDFPLILDYVKGFGVQGLGSYLSGGVGQMGASAGLGLNTWYHLAATRQGKTMQLFKDGLLIDSLTTLSVPVVTIDCIGGWIASGYRLYGYLDEVRITKGFARYVDTFTPPSEPFLNQA